MDLDVQRHEPVVAKRRVEFDDAIELRVPAAQCLQQPFPTHADTPSDGKQMQRLLLSPSRSCVYQNLLR
ncbi:hypothetical protein [Burkholderia ubonensis]|uniref:hypothetical protein n=1 Tax=Burkholderia ubonensis TaxID=101571 RepID=UPI001E3420F8|nr:hypothetical protein [Burkholderia ubonensis]